MAKTKRVCLKKSNYDIYIGRGSIWGNPYTHIKNKKTKANFIVKNREEAIEKYEEYLLNNEELFSKIHELKGKILGCYCSINEKCHGDILIKHIETNKLF
jgi:hypothetical protein